MPLKKCSESDKSGWKWGDAGKCYSGPDGKKKAIQQGISIEGPEKFQRMASSREFKFSENDIPFVSYALYDSGYSLASIVAVVATIRDSLSRADKDAGYPPNCNEGYIEQDGKCVPEDSQARHYPKREQMRSYKEGGPVCPKGHSWDDKTETCLPANGTEAK